MGEIKSALELALERTRGIPSDPEALRRHEAQDQGKRLFAKAQSDPEFDVRQALKEVGKDRRAWVREGLFGIARSNLTLPQAETDLQRVDTIERVLTALVRDRGALKELMRQVRGFFRRYLDDRNHLVEDLRRQYEPRMKQKEQQMAQQYGRQVKLDPAHDPEFSRVLQDNIGQLDGQYRGALQQVDVHLRSMFEQQ